MDRQTKPIKFMDVFDVLFVMVLCFATLLSTMLIQGGVLVGGHGTTGIHYHFGATSLVLVVLAFVLYLGCVVLRSDRELREMVARQYQGDGEGEAQ